MQNKTSKIFDKMHKIILFFIRIIFENRISIINTNILSIMNNHLRWELEILLYIKMKNEFGIVCKFVLTILKQLGKKNVSITII